ncbi:MAG: hypothetical protein LBU69_06370, partial [Deltaproteobacteria bacterium]|nr:hypothetical protein [Deltaproteobacteria bacterium]
MEQRTLESFEYLCSQDAPPACQSYCPIQVEAGSVTSQVASGHVNEARKTLERHMPLAGLCGRLCEGPCLGQCLRAGLDSPVNIPLIEAHVASNGRAVKPFPMPATKNTVALVGCGLSAMVCAYGLALKGHKAVIYHEGRPGQPLARLVPGKLPGKALEEAIDLLRYLKVEFRQLPTLGTAPPQGQGKSAPFLVGDMQGPMAIEGLIAGHSAVFLSTEDPCVQGLGLGIGQLKADPVTRGTGRERLFLGPAESEPRHIDSMSAGKKAAASMDRLFQGASPSAAREKEAVGPTRLVIDLSGREKIPPAP